MGFLSPPEGRGRVIWVRAGASDASLRLGVEMLGAVREKRQDVRIVLTFERDNPVLLQEKLKPWPKVGIGYGPADRRASVRRVLSRFQPSGMILVDTQLPDELMRQIQAPVIALLDQPLPKVTPGPGMQLAWVCHSTAESFSESTDTVQHLPVADPEARFVEAQADVVLRSLLAESITGIWIWIGSLQHWPAFHEAWSMNPVFQKDILLVHLTDSQQPPGVQLRITEWDRSTLKPGTIMSLDDARWLAASASAAVGVHLQQVERRILWQSLAVGTAVSTAHSVSSMEFLPVLRDPVEVLSYWHSLRGNSAERRQAGDAARQRFWKERRQVDANLDHVLRKVWDW